MSILGFASLAGADRETTFIAGDARVFDLFGGEEHVAECSGMFFVSRRGELAIGFEIENFSPHVDRRAGQNSLVVATAEVEARNGLDVITGILLHGSASHGAGRAWKAGRCPTMLSDECRSWLPHVVVASMGGSARPPLIVPPTARPAGDKVAVISLRGEISEGLAGSVTGAIVMAAGKTIDLRIDTIGGAVQGARRIYDALASHDCMVLTHVESKAHSAGSLIAAAGDVRTIATDGNIMMHPAALGVDAGPHRLTANLLSEMADECEAYDRETAGLIALQIGRPVDVVHNWIKAETVLTAGEAFRTGFVHRIVNDVPPLTSKPRKAVVRAINGPYGGYVPARLKRGRA